MSMSLRLLAPLALACAAACAPSWSATVVVNASIAVANIEPGKFGFTAGAQDMPPFTGVSPFTLAINDTLDYTIDFVGNQTITITDASFLWPLVYSTSGGSQQTTATGSLQLLDANGSVLLTSATKTSTEGIVHIGQNFSDTDFGGGLSGPVTIGGLHYVGTVDAFVPATGSDPVITSRDYASPGLYLTAGSFVAGVPEPSEWLLLLAGLAAVGGMTTRRRAR
jgi:hypothetical protein